MFESKRKGFGEVNFGQASIIFLELNAYTGIKLRERRRAGRDVAMIVRSRCAIDRWAMEEENALGGNIDVSKRKRKMAMLFTAHALGVVNNKFEGVCRQTVVVARRCFLGRGEGFQHHVEPLGHQNNLVDSSDCKEEISSSSSFVVASPPCRQIQRHWKCAVSPS